MGRKAKQATPAPATETPPPPESKPSAPAPPVIATEPEGRGRGRPPGNPMPAARTVRLRARKLLGLRKGDEVDSLELRLAELAVLASCGPSQSQRDNIDAERKCVKELIRLRREDLADEDTNRLVKTAQETTAAVQRQRGGHAQRASSAPALSYPANPPGLPS